MNMRHAEWKMERDRDRSTHKNIMCQLPAPWFLHGSQRCSAQQMDPTLSRENAVWREAASSMSANASFSSRLSCALLGLYLRAKARALAEGRKQDTVLHTGGTMVALFL